jgi:DNA-directed RNA polymerase subunit M/transcription elongation factor TFIIS
VPISCKCPSCGKVLKAPDSAAGKRAKCPGCGNPVKIPAAKVHEAEEVADGDDEFGIMNTSEDDAYGGPAEDRKPCPSCGEMIKAEALKCRYCGEVFDETLKRKEKKKRSRSSSGDDDNLSAVEWVLCILCSGIACIVGLVYGIQGKPKGWKMLGIALAMQVFWVIVRVVIELAVKQ